MYCCKCIISGRVQGVYYRGSTRKQAQALGVTGYAKNLQDGSVEVLMCGDVPAVESLQNWLAVGPQYADVSKIKCQQLEIAAEELPLQFSTA